MRLELQNDNESPKVVLAFCSSSNKVVIGGGGLINSGDARLTELQPTSSFFIVAAERPFNLIDQTQWPLFAYAICMNRSAFRDANGREHYTIIGGGPAPSSKTFQTAMTPSCPSGTVAYSAGGQISTCRSAEGSSCTPSGAGHMGLQLVRNDGRLGIGRATAREDVAGFSGNWTVASFAVCATPLASGVDTKIHAEDTIPPDPLATTARHTCSGNFWLRGIGGGGGLIDGGPAFLRQFAPSDFRNGVPKGMVVSLTRALNRSVGGMVAHPSCALGF